MSVYQPESKTIQRISLFLTVIFTLFAIYKNQVSVFYIIYLFWCDELIRSLFDKLAFHFQPEHIEDKVQFKKVLRGRFFILTIYFVFITVIFGLVVSFENKELILQNFSVFFLKNIWFNITLLSIIGREAYQFFSNDRSQIYSHDTFSAGMIVLHISIILGMFGFLFSNIIPDFLNKIDNIEQLLAVLPFLIIKLIFEWFGLRSDNQ